MKSKILLFILSGIIVVGCKDDSGNPEPEFIAKKCLLINYSSSVDSDLYSSSSVSYTPDSLVKEINSVYADWLEAEDEKTSFIYGALNRLEKIEIYTGSIKTQYYKFKYGNNIIHRLRYTSINGIDFTLRADSIQFILNNEAIQSFISYSSGVMDRKEAYEYDANGNAIKMTEYKTNGTVNKVYTIQYQSSNVNPNRIIYAGGLLSVNYTNVSLGVATMVDDFEFDNEFDDNGNLVSYHYTNLIEPWTIDYEYVCKD